MPPKRVRVRVYPHHVLLKILLYYLWVLTEAYRHCVYRISEEEIRGFRKNKNKNKTKQQLCSGRCHGGGFQELELVKTKLLREEGGKI